MIDFWMATGLLLLVALGFLLIPVLRGHRAQREEDRTALNVALYQERLAELQAQHEQGMLSAQQRQDARAEAARELLADTEGAEPVRASRLGRPVLLRRVICIWGASDRVELSREFAKPPTSLADMTRRLERSVQAQPDSAENLYFLARSYMAQNRPGDAAHLFERAVALAGRQPELLGQWAQALYFASDKHFTPQVQALTDEALQADPKEVISLGLLGIAAFETQRYQAAVDYWTRLLAALPAQDASRSALEGGIARAREHLAQQGASVKPKSLKVRVALAASLEGKVQPTDSVFIFARAINGPAAPLAWRTCLPRSNSVMPTQCCRN